MPLLKPTLSFSCLENWDNMKIGMLSRHCENCNRDVQDFTKMSREEVLRYLLTNRGNKVCGRIRRSQLDYHHTEILVTIDRYLKTSKSSNLSFYLLSMSALLMIGCVDESGKFQTTTEVVASKEGDLEKPKTKCYDLPDSIDPPEVMGFIVMGDSSGSYPLEQSDVRTVVEVMPEFPGGIHALMKYMTENLKRPKNDEFTGTIFAEFVVHIDGTLKDIKILRGASPAFDREVIRLIEGMPLWKAGMEGGKKVKVRYVVPVRVI